MNTSFLLLFFGAFGILGTITLLTATGWVIWLYRDARRRSFRWHLRKWRLKQLSALACLFFLAMAASYGVLHETWGWFYLMGAFETGLWWLRAVIGQRA